jgi:hypothetical protein
VWYDRAIMADNEEKPSPYIGIADFIWNGLPDDPDLLRQMVRTGCVYHPFVPLQVTKLTLPVPKIKL